MMFKGKLKAILDLAPGRNLSEEAYNSSLTDEEKEDIRLFKDNFAAELIRRKFPRAPQFLQERLATAMSRRWQHFRYLKWLQSAQQAKPTKPSKPVLSKSLEPSFPPQIAAPVPNIAPTTPTQALRLDLEPASASTWVGYKTTRLAPAATIASSMMGTETYKPPEAWGAQKETAQELKLAYPPLPNGGAEPSCPYCYQTLSEDAALTRKMWREHIERDLKAYVCLREKCPVPNETYSQEAWLAHTRRELAVDVQASEEELFPSCPLCNADLPRLQRRQHISNHLKYLALKCLPWRDDVESVWSKDSTTFGSAGAVAGSLNSSASAGSPLNFETMLPTMLPESDEEFAWSNPVDGIERCTGDLRQEEWGAVLNSKTIISVPNDPLYRFKAKRLELNQLMEEYYINSDQQLPSDEIVLLENIEDQGRR